MSATTKERPILVRMFRWLFGEPRKPNVIDMRKTCWGNSVTVIKGSRIAGWSTPRPVEGDLIVWTSARTREPVYHRLVNIEHCPDPDDMWFANAVKTEAP